MILSQLTLRNFCLYAGEQVFDLEPVRLNGRRSPVVLFGGVNGAGKTTILDAVQLVLYGKRAQCSKRFDKAYDQFLRESIHQSADSSEGASVGLSFRYASRGKEDLFEVIRAWKPATSNVREQVRVLKNGAFDQWLSENWNQVVEELIPQGIAQLCFFDAEKIRFLADDETSSQAVGEAIKSLLGLDLAERLVADADVLRGRIAKRCQNEDFSSRIEQLEAELEDVDAEISQRVQELGSLENPRLAASERLRKSEDTFSRIGGKHWESRAELQREKALLERARQETQQQLVELSATELPLALVQGLLGSACSQVEKERLARSDKLVIDLLEQRDTHLLKAMSRIDDATPKLVETIGQYLRRDREDRVSVNSTPIRLNLSEGGEQRIRSVDGNLPERVKLATNLLEDYEQQGRELSDATRSLNVASEGDAIRDVADELKAATRELATHDQNCKRVEKVLGQLRVRRGELFGSLSKLREKSIQQEIHSEEDQRLLNLLERTRTTMGTYLENITFKKIDRLSERITESFQFLIRKRSLVQRVLIDHKTFSITLRDWDGNSVPKERLSEGEKQLFAISVLWGLARSSSRPLPAIIDTPMGRLDATHRDQLVERYFPHASHQVIVLSTDTEIERKYFEKLQPAISRAYHLRYDEALKQTVPEEGYFWKHEANGVQK